MKKSAAYEAQHAVYADILEYLEDKMSSEHFSYAFLNARADEYYQKFLAFTEQGNEVEATKALMQRNECIEELAAKTSAYGNIYKVVCKHLGIDND